MSPDNLLNSIVERQLKQQEQRLADCRSKLSGRKLAAPDSSEQRQRQASNLKHKLGQVWRASSRMGAKGTASKSASTSLICQRAAMKNGNQSSRQVGFGRGASA